MNTNANSIASDVIRILLVDDDEDDRFIVQRALQAISRESVVHTAANGEEMLTQLRKSNDVVDQESNAWPHFILLDLNMPCMDGREALTAIKADPDLRSIPVIVLTTSSGEGDVRKCYELGVNSYLVKPKAYDELLDTIQRLMDYWSDLVLLPNNAARRSGL